MRTGCGLATRGRARTREGVSVVPEQMGVFEVIYSCRAMRRLKPDPVPEELLLKLCEAGNQGPSGSNIQGVRWVIVREQAQKDRLAEMNKTAVEAYVVGSRVDALPHQSAAKRRRMVDAVIWQAEHLGETPAIVVACHEWAEAPADVRERAAAGSVWPAVQNLLLAARALGLGAAPTTLGLTDKSAVKEALTLPDTVEPYVLVPVGHPKGRFGPVSRLPVSETVHFDRW
jgi:nitroreductase